MNSKDKKIQIASFDDTTVVGINSSLPDHKLAWCVNNALAIDLSRYDDLVFEGDSFAFYYYNAGENYNVYNLVSLNSRDRVLYPFKPRLDFLFLIQNTLPAERQTTIMRSLRQTEGITHAFVLEKDKNLRFVLETIAECEQQMINKKRRQTDIHAVKQQMKEQEEALARLRAQS